MSQRSSGMKRWQWVWVMMWVSGATLWGQNAVDGVRFSVTRGFYDEPVTVELSCLTAGATIRYRLNGQGNVADGQVYTQPLEVTTTTCIQAMATKNGWQDSNAVSHTYIFLDDVLEQPKWPDGFPTKWDGKTTMNGHSIDYQMDPDVVDDYADELRDALLAIPSMCVVIPNDDFFGDEGLYSNGKEEGDEWERVTGLEWIDPETGAHFGVNAGLRSHGGVGRREVKHSLRAIFRGEYGLGKLEFPLFKDSTVDVFDQLILRATWNYSWVGDSTACNGLGLDKAQYLRETFARDTSLALGILTPHARHVHLYVNGLYWGLYILSERPDDGFAEEHLGGDKADYDVLKAGNSFSDAEMEVKAGDAGTWDWLYYVIEGDLESDVPYRAVQQLVDVNDLIDYMLMIYLIGSRDAPVLLCNNENPRNFYTIRRHDPAGPFVFLPWDCEWSLERVNENRVDIVGEQNPHLLMNRLSVNDEFRMLLADHIYCHFYNDGALTESANIDRYQQRAEEIYGPIIGESARWGDLRRSTPYTRDNHWVDELERLIEDYFPDRTERVLDQLKDEDWYPSFDPPTFKIEGKVQSGGYVDVGDKLTLIRSNSSATTYYTLDGTDPRAPGGDIRTTASTYSKALTLDASVQVKARGRKSNGTWSALHEAVYAVGDMIGSLRVSEIMYHPEEAEAEYIELTNIGSSTLNLAGVAFTDGIEFTFADVELKKDNYIVVVSDQAAFEAVYGTSKTVAGEYEGKLGNGGERVVLRDALGTVIQDFVYDDQWIASTDGGGYSLVIHDTDADLVGWSEPGFWKPSKSKLGSPAAGESRSNIEEPGPVVIAEIMYHPRLHPDAEYVELVNVSNSSVTLYNASNKRTWRLTDGGESGLQFAFSGSKTIKLAKDQRLLLVKDEAAFTSIYGDLQDVTLYAWGEGSLSNSGESLQLFEPTTSNPDDDLLVDQVRYSDGMQGENFTRGQDPWPVAADGMGRSLARVNLEGYGNFVGNWQAVEPTPGRP